MKKNNKKYVFEFDNLQMALFFAGVLVVCLLSFAIGVKIGVEKGKVEMRESALKNDLRYKIKAPSLIDVPGVAGKAQPAVPAGGGAERGKSPTIDSVIDASIAKDKVEATETKASVKKPSTDKTAQAEPKPEKKAVGTSKNEGAGSYFVQVAAFRAASDAKARSDELVRKGYSPLIVKAEVPGKGTYHRVRLGPFATMKEARAAAARFEKKEKVSVYIPKN